MNLEEQNRRLLDESRKLRAEKRELHEENRRLRELAMATAKAGAVRGMRFELREERGKIIAVATAPGSDEQYLAHLVGTQVGAAHAFAAKVAEQVFAAALREIASDEEAPGYLRRRARQALEDAGYPEKEARDAE